MGLTPHYEHKDAKGAISFAETLAGKYLDMPKIIDIARSAETLDMPLSESITPPCLPPVEATGSGRNIRIGVFRDAAFQFYYPENLEELQKCGAEIVGINAIESTALPTVDALYIGGGFPETNALKLAQNESFRVSLKDAADRGLPIYAECGGLMFLSEAIIMAGQSYQMAGIFPLVFEMRQRPEAHGYTVVEVDHTNPFYPVGTLLHGHEFHYSAVLDYDEKENIFSAFKMKRGRGIADKRDGICYRNVLGTYTHIHALGSPAWVSGLINMAKEYKEKNV